MNYRNDPKVWRPAIKIKPKRQPKPRRLINYDVLTTDTTVRALFEEAARQNVTCPAMAEKLGVHENTVSSWRVGHTFPNSQHMSNMAQVLGYEITLKPKER